jgi:transcriptional regulator with XRE-family HTH domain
VFFVVLNYNNLCYTFFMKEDAKKLGENLKKIRTRKNVSQVEIANILGVNRSFVSNIENGKNNPTLSTIANLAKALKVPVEDLFK